MELEQILSAPNPSGQTLHTPNLSGQTLHTPSEQSLRAPSGPTLSEPGSAKLEPKLIRDVTGTFLVPSYQRGYRWGKNEVERLLTDIYQNGDQNYCLQPIVVRREGNTYRVIDGQQRLTTIYLIYKYIRDTYGSPNPPRFTLSYETRPGSARFLASTPQEMVAQQDENIDYWFMSNAYACIGEWFSRDPYSRTELVDRINQRFENYVSVIWYEVGETEDEKELFTRLNSDKIPLTSAELIKAMLLSRSAIEAITDEKTSEKSEEQQKEIALAWDNIEKELSSESLWYFLTNSDTSAYQTHIDLIFDLIADIPARQAEPYATFFYFDKLRQSKKPAEIFQIWDEIELAFLILKDWYEDHDLYHGIGYLIFSGSRSLSELYRHYRGQTKTEFKQFLFQAIRDSIDIKDRELEDLEYGKDSNLIQNILILFNVESVSQSDDKKGRIPFDKLKSQNWSLEHIHAQHAKSLKTKSEWRKWLELQLGSLKNVIDTKNRSGQELIAEIENMDLDSITERQFDELEDRVVKELSKTNEKDDYLHTIANLALLDSGNNAALSNSTFDVKRTTIIKKDQSGKYIPFCTKMVFLKYYTDSSQTDLHFWCDEDRKCYLKRIKEVLGKYNYTEEIQNAA